MIDEKVKKKSSLNSSGILLWWIPVISGLILCAFTFVIWQKLEIKENTDLRDKIQVEADYRAVRLGDDINKKIADLKQIARIWGFRQNMTKAEFIDMAQFIISENPGLKAVEWIDSSIVLQWIASTEGNKRHLDFKSSDSAKLEKELKKSLEYGVSTISMPIGLISGQKGFVLIVPLYLNTKFNGFIFGVISAGEWLESVFRIKKNAHSYDQYRTAVVIDSVEIYRENELEKPQGDENKITRTIQVMNHEIELITYPSESLIQNSKSGIINYALAAGLLFCLVFAAILHLLKKNSLQKNRLHVVNLEIEREIGENRKVDQELRLAMTRIDIATKAGNIGIWTRDLNSGTMIWSERMFDFFDIPTDVIPSFDKMKFKLHPDDQVKLDSIEKNAIAGTAKFDTELRIIQKDGSSRTLRMAARVERDKDEKPLNITGLCWDITEQKKSEQTIWHLSEMRKIIMEISSQNINVSSKDAPVAIQKALKMMGEFVSADRAYVSRFDLGTKQLTFTYEWCNDGIESNLDNLKSVPAQGLLEWISSHAGNEPIAISNIKSLPEGKLKKMFELQGLKSVVKVPMLYKNEIIGFVGFESVKENRAYSENELDLLKLFSQTLVNIHARSLTETALQESEEKIHLILNSAGEAIFGVDSNNICVFANHSAARILGYPNVLLFHGKNLHELVKHSDKNGKMISSDECKICNALKLGESIHNDNEMFHKADGTGIYVEYWSHPQMVNEIITGAVVTFVDITERKKMQVQIAEERMRLSSILEGTNVGTWEWNVQTGETLFNERWAEIIGYSLEELKPVSIKTWEKVSHPDDLQKSGEELEKHFRGEADFYVCEVRLKHKNGSWVWVLDKGKVTVWTEDGKPLMMYGTHQDITQMKAAEEEREQLIVKLEKSLSDVHKLSGMLPICASCKRIRDDNGYWNQIEKYIKEHSEADFTHGLCPECVAKLYPEFKKLNKDKPD